VIPLPEGRAVRVQPVHVDDVVRGLEHLLARDRFDGDVLELGGPRPMPFREFLQLIQSALRGVPGRITSIPLAPIRLGLAAIEPVLRPLMPVTAGQLSVFANDSVASENWLLAELRAGMPTTEETIAALVAAGGRGDDPKTQAKTQASKPPRQTKPLSESSQRVLVEECRTFAAYLVGGPSSAYIEERYALAARGVRFPDSPDLYAFLAVLWFTPLFLVSNLLGLALAPLGGSLGGVLRGLVSGASR